MTYLFEPKMTNVLTNSKQISVRIQATCLETEHIEVMFLIWLKRSINSICRTLTHLILNQHTDIKPGFYFCFIFLLKHLFSHC